MDIVAYTMIGTEEIDFEEKDPTGRYIRYGEILGKGAFKIVYKAFDQVEGIEVAWNQIDIDVGLQSSQQLDRLYSEVNLLRSLKHENIMKFYDSWVDMENKTINMITELFTSGSLRQYRRKHKIVDIRAIKNWSRQILLGLQYLHSHKPQIIHRDLKCDNIFVNGNNGEVKIGDLGFAIVMQQPYARTVIGTPEFMAPELYDEEYNELVDIYSFGLCMLEMVTCEYPYMECKNAAQIYKKVTTGIKPASLGKVVDPQVKQFIEKCLVPVSMRLSAAELLKDPFLSSNITKEAHSAPQQFLNLIPKSLNQQTPEALPMDIDHDKKNPSVPFTKVSNVTSHHSSLEFQKFNNNTEFKLKGQQADDNTISLSLKIIDLAGHAKNIHFMFYLDSDTSRSIASEMVEQLDLANEDIALIAELLDSIIVKLVPEVYFSGASSYQDCSVNCNVGAINQPMNHSSSSEISIASRGNSRVLSDSCADSCYKGSNSDTSNMSLSSIGFLSLEDKDDNGDADLKVEMHAIDSQYQQWFCDLLKMKELAIENAKQKWIA